MGNITIGRYDDPAATGWQGWFEPDDKSWIGFIGNGGRPVVFLDRDPVTGAVR